MNKHVKRIFLIALYVIIPTLVLTTVVYATNRSIYQQESAIYNNHIALLADSLDGSITDSEYLPKELINADLSAVLSDLFSELNSCFPNSLHNNPNAIDIQKMYSVVDSFVEERFSDAPEEDKFNISNLFKGIVTYELISILQDVLTIDTPWLYNNIIDVQSKNLAMQDKLLAEYEMYSSKSGDNHYISMFQEFASAQSDTDDNSVAVNSIELAKDDSLQADADMTLTPNTGDADNQSNLNRLFSTSLSDEISFASSQSNDPIITPQNGDNNGDSNDGDTSASDNNDSTTSHSNYNEVGSASNDKTKHVPGEAVVTVEPTCTKPGKSIVYCEDCGKALTTTTIPALGHKWSEWRVVNKATCKAAGLRSRTCANCGETETEEIPKLNHVPADTYTVDLKPTCTSSGIESKHCVNCGEIFEDTIQTIEPLGHKYTITTVNSTCDQAGNEHYVCSVCGDTKDVAIDRTQHKFSDTYTVDQAPTCLDTGSKSFHCLYCDAIDPLSVVNIPVSDHIPSAYVIDKAATCTQAGSKSRFCTACHALLDTVKIPPIGHKYGAKQNFDCHNVVDGYVHRVCRLCDDTEKGHDIIVQPISYNIKFSNIMGAFMPSLGSGSLSYDIETDMLEIPNPTKEGYTFIGWSLDGGEPQLNLTIPKGTIGDHEISANWIEHTYTLHYDLMGGSGGTSDTVYSYTDAITPLKFPNVYRTGYTFCGWAASKEDALIAGDPSKSKEERAKSTLITPDTEECSKLTANDGVTVTLYAIWSLNDYSIVYDLDGGELLEGSNPEGYNVESDTFTLINPRKLGYSFVGWSGPGIETEKLTLTIEKGSTGNRRYVAVWKEREYHIRYAKGLGDRGEDVLSKDTFKFTSSAVLEPTSEHNFERDGYDLTGWDVDHVKIDEYVLTYEDDDYLLAHGILVNATYTPITYDIKYKGIAGCEFATTNPATYDIVTDTFTLCNPTKRGCTFTGWTGTNLTEATMEVEITLGTYGELEFTANFTPNVYNISYDIAGGEFVDPYADTYTFGTGYTLGDSETVKRDGYTFDGWYSTDDIDGDPVTEIDPTEIEDRSFVAKWTTITYNITYDLNKGSVIGNPSTYNTETPDITLRNPSRIGYTFTGWSGTDLDTITKSVTIPTGSLEDRNYVAHYVPNKYDVTYHLNNGSLTSGTALNDTYVVKHTYDTVLPLLTSADISRPGYVFKGWYTDKSFNSDEQTEVSAKLADSIEYWAKWDIITYNITYTLDGGTNASSNPSSYTVEDTITLEYPSKIGYTFTGWSGTDLEDNVKDVVIAKGSLGNRHYVAHYVPNKYNVTYHLNKGSLASGTVLNDTYVVKHTYDTVLPLLTSEDISRPGYIFKGWYTDKSFNGDVQTEVSDKLDDAIDYWAKWQTITYDITYSLNGGDNASSNPSEYNTEDTITLLNAFKEGYNFTGWTEDGVTTTPELGYTIEAGQINDKAFTAHFVPKSISVHYDANKGTGTMADQILHYNPSGVTLSINAFNRTGYHFMHWNTKADDSGTTFVNSADMRNYIADHDKDELTLYAIWEANSMMVTLHANGGVGEDVEYALTYDSNVYLPDNPFTREGYHMASWNTKADGSGKTYADHADMSEDLAALAYD